MNSFHDHRSPASMGYLPQPSPPPPPHPYPHPPGPYQGTPAYASPYQNYPPPPTSNPKDYSSQSFTVWFASDKFNQWTPEPTNSQKFARLMCATLITLLLSLLMVSLVVWLLFGTDFLDFRIASFNVYNLSVSGSVFSATWTANMTITNPKSQLQVNPGAIKASVLYKDYPLAMDMVEPMYTQQPTEISTYIKLEHGKSICKEDLAAEITAAENAGKFVLSLRLGVGSKFSIQSGWTQDTSRVYCEDLKLRMTSPSQGELAQDSSRRCNIYVRS